MLPLLDICDKSCSFLVFNGQNVTIEDLQFRKQNQSPCKSNQVWHCEQLQQHQTNFIYKKNQIFELTSIIYKIQRATLTPSKLLFSCVIERCFCSLS
jgi:hypothetical protein